MLLYVLMGKILFHLKEYKEAIFNLKNGKWVSDI